MPTFRFLRALFPALLLTVVSAANSVAQTPGWSVPLSGYVQDEVNLSIRPVLGFPGSAVLGPAVLTEVQWASVAPNQKSAIVRQGASTTWIPDLGNASQATAVGQIDEVQNAFWSADSARAVVMLRDNNLAWLDTAASSAAAQTVWKLDQFTTSGARGQRPRWSVLAVDPAADRVLLKVDNGGILQVWSASKSAPPSLVTFAGDVTAAAFAAQGSAVYLADAAAHQVVKLDRLDPAAAVTTVITSDAYVHAPVGIALSADGRSIYLVDSGVPAIRVISVQDGSLLSELPISEAAASLMPLSPVLFLVKPARHGAESLYFLNTSVPPTVYFVPRGE